jgi:hypothetical protein
MKTLTLLCVAASLAGCVSEDIELAETESELSVWQWTDDVKIPNQASSYQPGLASFAGRLRKIHTKAGSTQLQISGFDTVLWSTPVNLPLYADYGPALTVLGSRLATVYHAAGQNRLLMATSIDGVNFSIPVTAGRSLERATLRYAPSIAAKGDLLYAAYCVTDQYGNHVWIDRMYTTGVWAPVKQFDVPGTCKHVALGVENSLTMHLVYTFETSSSWYLAHSRMSVDTWSTPVVGSMKSKKPPSIVTCNGVTHLVHGGYSNPDEIWWSFLNLGAFVGDAKVPNQASSGGAALGCHANTAYMVHNGGYSDLWWSEFGL